MAPEVTAPSVSAVPAGGEIATCPCKEALKL